MICRREGTDKVPTREIQWNGPGGLRDKAVILEAVKELAELGRARLARFNVKGVILADAESMAYGLVQRQVAGRRHRNPGV
jgi:hypothetical protein